VQKIFAVIILSSFLAACGSSDESKGVDLPTSGGASLADIVGVWDASEMHGQLIDEHYLIIYRSISSDGKIVGKIGLFDYRGDSFNSGENCYEATIDDFIDYGFGDFEVRKTVDDKYFIKAELSGNELLITDEDGISKIYPESMLEVFYLEDEDTLCK
jgi:hypothetical protein